MYKLARQFNILLNSIERTFPALFPKAFPPGLLPALSGDPVPVERTKSVLESWKEHILWAVPKHRRTIERRLKRKYGTPGLHVKLLLPKTNLRVCNSCGHDHEVGVLCPNCYKKVKAETEAMQEAIQSELKLDPVDKEVVVLYDGEREKASEHWNGKRIVEMKKARPLWFSRNLVEKTTQQPTDVTQVNPKDLS